MRKTVLTALGAAVIAIATTQVVSAHGDHHARKVEQFRNASNAVSSCSRAIRKSIPAAGPRPPAADRGTHETNEPRQFCRGLLHATPPPAGRPPTVSHRARAAADGRASRSAVVLALACDRRRPRPVEAARLDRLDRKAVLPCAAAPARPAGAGAPDRSQRPRNRRRLPCGHDQRGALAIIRQRIARACDCATKPAVGQLAPRSRPRRRRRHRRARHRRPLAHRRRRPATP